jgi:hypothetical protein
MTRARVSNHAKRSCSSACHRGWCRWPTNRASAASLQLQRQARANKEAVICAFAIEVESVALRLVNWHYVKNINTIFTYVQLAVEQFEIFWGQA